jgi:hypothetical protein
MTRSVSRVPVINPTQTTTASGWRSSAPSPNPIAMGTRPSTVVNVVMRIGRMCTWAAFTRPPPCPTGLTEAVHGVDEDDRVVHDDAREQIADQRHHVDRKPPANKAPRRLRA